jgi:hypothetical protein
MSQQSVRQAARRAALDAQAVRRKDRAERERRLEVLAVEVMTAIGERDRAVWDAERRAGEALRTMTGDEGLSVRAAADWCGNAITSREVTRLRRLAPDTPAAPAERLTCQCRQPGCLARRWRTQRQWLGYLLQSTSHGGRRPG